MDTDVQHADFLRIRSQLPFALKPILGFVKMRLLYDKSKFTDKFILSDRINQNFFSFKTGLAGNNTLLLPDIKEYNFSNAIIFFEDMLQFFKFTSICNLNQNIYNLPHSLLYDTNEIAPKKTEEEKIRIQQLKKVEGELLHYKKFEDSDDVRRIVWKIFAKNKELVVRVPEIMDPFASHIYMYASFYNDQHFQLHPEYHQEMINHFKNSIWTIFDSLSKKEFEVRFISDQHQLLNSHEKKTVQKAITLSQWHKDKSLSDYFKIQNGSILCIHSYTPINELTLLLSSTESNTNIFFIQLSKVFKSHYILNFLIRIFFKPPPDHLSSLRSRWAIHPLKFQTLNNEKALLSLLKKSNLNIELI
jgi:hypothetical protein